MHLLVNELYTYQNAQFNNKNWKFSNVFKCADGCIRDSWKEGDCRGWVTGTWRFSKLSKKKVKIRNKFLFLFRTVGKIMPLKYTSHCFYIFYIFKAHLSDIFHHLTCAAPVNHVKLPFFLSPCCLLWPWFPPLLRS